MAPTVAEDTVPLMLQEKEESQFKENELRVVDIVVVQPTLAEEAPVKRCRAFIFRRVTYYWILVFSQFLQASLCVGTYAVIAAEKAKNKDIKTDRDAETGLLASGIYSFMAMIYAIVMLVSHYNGEKSKINAGRHVAFARTCLFMAGINFFFFYRRVLTASSRGQLGASHCVKEFFVPAAAVLLWVSFLAGGAAAFITKRAAKRALGTAMVQDPNHRVPAWTLATTDEVNGIQLA
ncbi:hypothetical protein D9613_012282 [Agrocybe pediades]|uniref:Transmembrane protein n=1 Tax=Agrocybe pediades TaxID=84607 RepID=A0A8H4QFK5_9AGAR|nr:hypothetical protein D9613_012282 [Agrocybe pediades]